MLKAGRHRPKALLTSQSHREPTQSRTGRQIWQHIPQRELCAAVTENKGAEGRSERPPASRRSLTPAHHQLQEHLDPESPLNH